ncbi:hypothetical protein D9756_008281 [Leucocoprinus leucothites]|uniref:F-box domain-containing protein n=1 Tax=Leucocoprinus leucothites TaxID=201217 RepID=A0A8H5D034_9AGAR|nr:hypothetical protein D9756_008281 [Leucoagaricus leucothites]
MPPSATLDRLPPEILEEIFAELEYDKGVLDALCLTCHALCARTRPHRFPTITLHDNNFNDFMKLTYFAPWNTIIPNIRQLTLGTVMFPLTHGYIRSSEFEFDWNSDLTSWAAQFSHLWTLDLRGAFWPKLPPCLVAALLKLRTDYLAVCLGEKTLGIEDLTSAVLPAIRPKTLTIAGPLWLLRSFPPPPPYIPEATPFYIHHMQLGETTPIRSLIDWLKSFNPPLSIAHLYIEMPKDKEPGYGLALVELLQLISPVHLRLKLPSTSRVPFKFPVGGFSELRTLQISSIYNGIPLAPNDQLEEEQGKLTDITITSRLLDQFSALQDHLRHIQLDSLCTHTNLTFGDIPEILRTSYPLLDSLSLTLRSGNGTRRTHLDEWLAQNPFMQLQARGVSLRVEAIVSDPILLLP